MTEPVKFHNNDDVTTDSGLPDLIIPVITEQLEVGKRLVKSGTVRVSKTVSQTIETIRESLLSEQVEVERVHRDEMVASPPAIRIEGDVTIIPVVEEILVVTKQFHLKEELRIIRKQVVHEHHQELTLRKENLIVERFNGSETA